MSRIDEIKLLDKYFRTVNYISACELYLVDNPLLQKPLKLSDIKKKQVGHWGTVPGQNFIYTHLNRVIKKYNLNMIYISGPGHGGNAMIANNYVDGTYSEVYPEITKNIEGLKKLFKQFSFPFGVSSHVAPETPGSINEGGELGYSLVHAYGSVLDNPDLISVAVVGDGEAETGPLATSWHLNKFINPKKDGAVLPILHLNGYKIANPSILARISKSELISLMKGYGYEPIIVHENTTYKMHDSMMRALDKAINKIKRIKHNKKNTRPIWPMIILYSLKGWTGPKILMDKKIEGTFRAHQIPIAIDSNNTDNIKLLERWLKSYRPEELFDEDGKVKKEIQALCPKGNKRMGASLYANGGLLLSDLKLPDFKEYMIDIKRGITKTQDMMEAGRFIRDVIKLNPHNFRIFGPDEALSNRLNHIFEITNRQFVTSTKVDDEFLNTSGRVIDSFLSEHVCEGLLEGYLLTGRHGLIHSYEAFIRIVDSMASQHAKWLKVCRELSWRSPIASLNYILTSHIWQQDHNGYTHQDPGFINHLVTKKADIVRIYLPCDTNTLISCVNHVLDTKNYINVIVASKHPSIQWLKPSEALIHTKNGIGVFKFSSYNDYNNPDIIFGCAGDTPTLEAIAASEILHKFDDKLNIKLINVIDLMKLVSNKQHPHGLTDVEYDKLFTIDKPIIFAFHGYPNLIHELTYNRTNHNLHVHGYLEEGTITTPFDMRVQNKLDRFNLVLSALKYIDINNKDEIIAYCNKKLAEHAIYIKENGIDMDEIRNYAFNK